MRRKLTPELKMQQARVRMFVEMPFFGTLATKLRWVEDKTTPTMHTDGISIHWNPDFVEKLDLQELIFVKAHEVMHCSMLHLHRIGHRNMQVWNIATDCVINQLLVNDNIGKFPSIGGIYDPKIYDQGNGQSEKIYELLLKNNKALRDFVAKHGDGRSLPMDGDGNSPAHGNQKSHDNLQAPKGLSKEELKQHEAEMRVKVAASADAARQAGKLSAGLERFVQKAIESKVNWRRVLHEFVGQRAKIERSYSILNPALLHIMDEHNMIFPGRTGEILGPIAVAIDCSGSIGNRELSAFAKEIEAVQQTKRPESMHIIYFDSKVCHYDKFDRDEDAKVSPHGGGGTAFSPIFEFIQDKGIDPVVCVVLTDMCCHDFGPAPHYPVLWMNTEPGYYNGHAPWGRVVPMEV